MLQEKMKLFFLLVTCYLSAVSYGATYLLVEYTKTQLFGSVTDAGHFLLLSGISALLLTGYSGKLSRNLGAHVIAALGVLATSLGMITLFFVITTSTAYYISALFIGLGWCFCYAASPMLTLSPKISVADRGRYISLISACVVLGTATLPSFFNVFCKIMSIKYIYLISFCIGVIAICFFIILGVMYPPKPQDGPDKESTPSSLFNLLKTEAVYPFLMVFLGACIVSTLLNFQTTYAQTKGLNYIVFYLIYSLSNVSARLFLGGVLTRKNPLFPVPFLMVIMTVGLLVLLFNSSSTLLYIISAVFLGVAYGLAYPLIKTYAVRIVPEDKRHDVLAGFTLSYFIGIYFFPIIVGIFYEIGGVAAYLWLLILVSCLYFFIALKRQKYAKRFFA